jgi:hypothetical protein
MSGTLTIVTPARLRIGAITLVTCWALAACSSMSCTLVGCFSGLNVDLSELATAYGPQPVIVTLCVEDDCQHGTIKLADGAHFGARSPTTKIDQSSPLVHVRVESAGQVLFDAKTTAHLHRFAPNGEHCGPICYTGSLTIVGGQLSEP